MWTFPNDGPLQHLSMWKALLEPLAQLQLFDKCRFGLFLFNSLKQAILDITVLPNI